MVLNDVSEFIASTGFRFATIINNTRDLKIPSSLHRVHEPQTAPSIQTEARPAATPQPVTPGPQAGDPGHAIAL